MFRFNFRRARAHRLLMHSQTNAKRCLTSTTFDRLLTQLTRHSVLLVLGFLSATAWSEELVESGVIADLDWQPRSDPVEGATNVVGAEGDMLTYGGCRYFCCTCGSELQVAARESEVTETDALFTGDVRFSKAIGSSGRSCGRPDRGAATATGSVMLREPGVRFAATAWHMTAVGGCGDCDATYVLHARQMAGAADQLTRFADGKIEIEDGA